MAQTFNQGWRRRVGDAAMATAVRLGVGPKPIVLLSVRGRTSGKLYSTPVTPVEYDGKRYLVSPFGERAWVKNAVAAGRVVLSRGRRHETVAVERVPPSEAAPVLRQYLNNRFVGRYFDITPQSTTDEIEAEAPRYPVLRVTPLAASASATTAPP